MNQYIEAGIFIRRGVRRYLLSLNIPFTEDKSLTDNVFYLRCSPQQYKAIINSLRQYLTE